MELTGRPAGRPPAVLRPRLAARPRRPLPARRTLGLTVALLVVGLAAVHWLVRTPPPASGWHLNWLELAVGFALADVMVFHVEINREAHTFSLSEIPFVFGLFFATPGHLIVGRLVGEVVILVLVERQTLVKVLFNLSLFVAECAVALTLFLAIIGGRSVRSPLAWLVALAAVGAADVVSALAVSVVIRWHGGRTDPGRLVLTAGATAAVNTCLAIVAGIVGVADRAALPLLLMVAVGLFVAYRGYASLTQRYAGLEMLYEFTRVTSGAMRPQATLEHILAESRRLLRADTALITLAPADGAATWLHLAVSDERPMVETHRPGGLPAALHQRVVAGRETVVVPRTTKDPVLAEVLREVGVRDCVVAPLLSGGVVTGTILVGDRLGDVSTFDGEDGRLFATLAAQAGVALENGRLIDRLHAEVAEREREALHDTLTGLPNRLLFASEVDRTIARSGTPAAAHAVLLMDLDRFKDVNDALGHHTGDVLLQEVAARLTRAVGSRGLVARLGGDEFAIVLPEVADVTAALELARTIHDEVAEPFRHGAIVLEVGASVGIAVYPEHGHDRATLLQRADVAMYAAKQARTPVAVYNASEDWNTADRLRLASELRAAIDGGQLLVHYQPVAGVDTGAIGAVEALVRWRHPELGLLPPDEFIPIAERNGLIEALTTSVLVTSLSQVRRWRDEGLNLGVAVNLPVSALLDVEFPGRIGRLLTDAGVGPDSLTLEITETGIMSDPERMIGVLEELRDGGVRISVDDFGTGYSSLAYLQRLPVSQLKIDKSFIQPMIRDTGAASIVRSIVELGRNLGLKVVAEGVEDQRTLDALRAMGCHHAQGYYFSRPVPGSELSEWLVGRRRSAGDGTEKPEGGHRPALRVV